MRSLYVKKIQPTFAGLNQPILDALVIPFPVKVGVRLRRPHLSTDF
jgi:hypothetical protein